VTLNLSGLLAEAAAQLDAARVALPPVPLLAKVFDAARGALRWSPLALQLSAAALVAAQLWSFVPVSNHVRALRRRYRATAALRRRRAAPAPGEGAPLLAGALGARDPLSLGAPLLPSADAPAAPGPGAAPLSCPPPAAGGAGSVTGGVDCDGGGGGGGVPPPPPRGAAPLDDAEALRAPDLRRFSFEDASAYIVAHVAVHLLACLIIMAFSVLAVSGVVVACGGAHAALLWAAAAARVHVYAFATTTLPPLVFVYAVAPLAACLGVDLAAACRPCRRAYVGALGWALLTDGPFVLAPRALLVYDTALSVTLGLFFGVVDALTRIALAVGWGAARAVVLWEPVVPRALASLDRPYMAYGGMLRAHSALLLDVEAGDDLPDDEDDGGDSSDDGA